MVLIYQQIRKISKEAKDEKLDYNEYNYKNDDNKNKESIENNGLINLKAKIFKLKRRHLKLLLFYYHQTKDYYMFHCLKTI